MTRWIVTAAGALFVVGAAIVFAGTASGLPGNITDSTMSTPASETAPPTSVVVEVPPTTGPVATGPTVTGPTVTGPPATPEPTETIGVPEEPGPEPSPPAASLAEGFTGTGTVVVAVGGADLATEPGSEPFVTVREGIVMAGTGQTRDGDWTRVYTMCDAPAWIRTDQIAATPTADTGPVGSGFDFGDAVIVVDPGHGGPNLGGHSPDGLLEKGINVDIAARLRDLLTSRRGIDWDTGAILFDGDIPAAGRVILTRTGEGDAADYEAGLLFRATVADTAGANAMVAIHNNAGWEVDLDRPGSDVYYQSHEPVTAESRRLATLLVEEFRRGFAGFDADWVGSSVLGAKSRLNPRDGVSQYYGILKNADVPTVIAEGAYIANPSEADLLRTPEFRQAYAEAVYRALVRFVTTDDPGDAPSHDPEVWDGFAGSGGARDDCEIPAQGGGSVAFP